MRKRYMQVLYTVALTLAATPAWAQEGLADGKAGFWAALAAGFGIAISSGLGALGQAKAIAAALEGIARNPAAQNKIMTPMILGLALIESLVIYTLVISFILIGKI